MAIQKPSCQAGSDGAGDKVVPAFLAPLAAPFLLRMCQLMLEDKHQEPPLIAESHLTDVPELLGAISEVPDLQVFDCFAMLVACCSVYACLLPLPKGSFVMSCKAIAQNESAGASHCRSTCWRQGCWKTWCIWQRH